MTTPNQNGEIKAVLVRLTVKEFINGKQDGVITKEILESRELKDGAGTWRKFLFPKMAFASILKAKGALRQINYDLTLPWESGLRLLPIKAREKYKQETDDAVKDCKAAVQEFLDEYAHWLKAAMDMHGKHFEQHLYPPTAADMKTQFHFFVEYNPVPKAADFITKGIAQDALEEMQKQLNMLNEARVKVAMSDAWTRLMIPVQKIAEKLATPDTIFRKSIVEDCKHMLDLIPQLNLTNDENLNALAKEIETKFSRLDAELVKTDGTVRKEASAAATEIVKRFGTIGKRTFALK